MSLTPKQELTLKKFAESHKHWPKAQLDAAIWQVKWHIQALAHQREPEDGEYDTFLMLAGRGSGKTHTAVSYTHLTLPTKRIV